MKTFLDLKNTPVFDAHCFAYDDGPLTEDMMTSQYAMIGPSPSYMSDKEREIIQNYIQKLEEEGYFSKEIVTEIKPIEKFYYAETYHQDYEKNNPNNPYVKKVSIPRLKKFQNQYPELLKENH